MIDHRQIDQRSLAFGLAIASKIETDPSIICVAKENLDRWMKTASPRLLPTFEEWKTLLEGPIAELVSVLTRSNERSIRLRQSNPFAGVLTQSERTAILLKYRSHEAS